MSTRTSENPHLPFDITGNLSDIKHSAGLNARPVLTNIRWMNFERLDYLNYNHQFHLNSKTKKI